MWHRTIKVSVRATDECELEKEFLDQITRTFEFRYTPFTKNRILLQCMCNECKHEYDSNEAFQRFLIYVNGQYYPLDENSCVFKVFRYFGCTSTVEFRFVIGLPGGAGIETQNGIHYFYHTKELRHIPHIHARYQGEEISIEILSLRIKGSFKNKKKLREAMDYVKTNKEVLLKEYNQKTNGIHIEEYYIEDNEMIPIVR